MKFGENEDITKMAMMAVAIAFMFFLLSPGTIWNFPEDPTCGKDGKVNKVNVVTHGLLFGIVLVLVYDKIKNFIYKN